MIRDLLEAVRNNGLDRANPTLINQVTLYLLREKWPTEDEMTTGLVSLLQSADHLDANAKRLLESVLRAKESMRAEQYEQDEEEEEEEEDEKDNNNEEEEEEEEGEDEG